MCCGMSCWFSRVELSESEVRPKAPLMLLPPARIKREIAATGITEPPWKMLLSDGVDDDSANEASMVPTRAWFRSAMFGSLGRAVGLIIFDPMFRGLTLINEHQGLQWSPQRWPKQKRRQQYEQLPISKKLSYATRRNRDILSHGNPPSRSIRLSKSQHNYPALLIIDRSLKRYTESRSVEDGRIGLYR